MTEGAQKRLGFSTIGDHEAKAKNIHAILAAAGRPQKPTQNVLDLGRRGGPEHIATMPRWMPATLISLMASLQPTLILRPLPR